MRNSGAAPVLRAVVSGSVQGVGFRAWTQFEARRLGLIGYVRNHPDGTVEIVASGDRSALEKLLTRLGCGPPAGKVRSVKVEWSSTEAPGLAAAMLQDGFEIRI